VIINQTTSHFSVFLRPPPVYFINNQNLKKKLLLQPEFRFYKMK
jgi:hypothetical protein